MPPPFTCEALERKPVAPTQGRRSRGTSPVPCLCQGAKKLKMDVSLSILLLRQPFTKEPTRKLSSRSRLRHQTYCGRERPSLFYLCLNNGHRNSLVELLKGIALVVYTMPLTSALSPWPHGFKRQTPKGTTFFVTPRIPSNSEFYFAVQRHRTTVENVPVTSRRASSWS
jgi:hypothetical protein